MWFCEDFLSGLAFPGFSAGAGAAAACLGVLFGALVAAVFAAHLQIRNANLEMRANRAVLAKLDCAAMRTNQFLRNGKPEAGAVAARRATERREKIVARLLRQAGAGILDADDRRRPDSSRRNR